MLLTVDLNENFNDEERVAVASVFSFQSKGVYDTKLDTPETNRFSADSDSSFGKWIFDVSVAEIEAIVQPDGVRNDVRWESVTFICIHWSILPISAS
jgi:hypothetical protein